MKKLLLLSLIALFSQKISAQCEVTASASPITIRCGQSSTLSAFGQSTGTVVLSENFNSGGFGSGWASTPGATNFSNPCSPGGVDGTPHAWMDDNTSVPRTLQSSPYNLLSATAGVTICFDLLFAEQGNSAPCEGPDEPDEGVYLQYSTNGGATWIDIHYFDPNGGNDPSLTNWNNWCFPIPAGAITGATMFRWHQTADSGADYDHWGIDNVEIYQNDVSANLIWLHDGYSYGVGNPGGAHPVAVSPTSTTTYTAQLTTGSGTVCTQSVTVTVLPPLFDVNIAATPNPVCAGSCAAITATAVEIISPESTPTFENNEFDIVGSGNASININVQGLNTTSLTNGSITQVVINGFTFSGTSFCNSFGGCPCGSGTVGFGQQCNLTPSSFTVTLTSPTGCTIILAPAGVAGGSYSNTVFVPVGGTALGPGFPSGGPWSPNQPFSNLNGCNPNGVWTLSFNAPGVGFGAGTLQGWSISFDDPAITGPATFVWSPTTNMTNSTTLTPSVCPPVTTTYNLTVANPTPGCATYTEGVTITVNNCTACIPPTVTITPPAAVCAPATINLSSAVTGVGTSIVTYHASNADATGDVNPLGSSVVSASGTYHVRVESPTDATCFSVQTITVTINPSPVVSVTPANPAICAGASTGLTASGATSYTWAPATGLSGTTGATVTASPSATTTYTVTGITGSCNSSATVTVTVTNLPVITVTPANPTICPGSNTTLTASGANTYTWAASAGLSGTSGASVTASPVATTTYTVTGTISGCSGSQTVTVNVSNNPVVSVTPVNPVICPGESISLTASGAGSYVWGPSAGLSSTSGAAVTANPVATTTYTVTGTTLGCSASAAVTVTVSNNLLLSVTPSSSTICPGGSTSLTVSGATTYTWANAAGLSTTTGATVTASPASTTTYTITGTSGSCTADTTVTVTVSNSLTVSVSPVNPVICPGGSVPITASGASNYTWANATGLSSTSGATVTASPATTTTYTITGTSGTCTDDTTITVTVSSAMVVSVSPASPTVCPGGSVSLTAAGATSYAWAAAAGLSSTSGATVTATPAATTTYTVTGTTGSCTASSTVTVTVSNNLLVSVTPVSATICPGGNVSITASGATGYTWAAAAGLSATSGATVTASPATTTTYTVTGTSGTCIADTTITITVSNSLLVSVTPASATICPGGSVSLTANGASTYSWASAAGLSATSGATVIASPASTATYTVTGTSGTCTADTTITITVASSLAISVSPSSPTVCQGDSVTLTANGASTYTWASASGLSSITGATVSAAPAVTTTYTVTGTSSGCTASTTITISVEPAFIVSVTPSSSNLCPGGSVSLTASGATTYSWAAAGGLSATTGATVTATPAATTTYTVTGTTNGCNADTTVIVNVAPTLLISVTPPIPSVCAGDSVALVASGASSYSWAASAGLSQTTGASVNAAPSVTTTYTVTGTSGSCSASTTVTVVVLPSFTVSVAPANATICEGSSVVLNAAGAVSYSWASATGLSSTTSATVTASPVTTTTYTITGTIGSCTHDTTITVTVIPLPVLVVNALPSSICAGNSSVLNASGATTYLWSPSASLSSSTDPSVTAIPPATTIYTVIGSNGSCNSNATVTVTVNPVTIADAGMNDTICFGGTGSLTASGGNTYTWTPSTGLSNPVSGNTSASPSVTTTYTVTVSNGGLCPSTDVVTVYVNPLPLVSAGSDAIINVGESVVLQGYGDSLTWSEINFSLNCYQCATPTASPLTGTFYLLSSVDINGCVNTDTVYVEVTQESAFYVPSAITPNGDGMNDVFFPKGYGIKEIHMMIFDRWGEKIFDNKIGEGWDGTYKGEIVKQDVYTYVINAVPYVGNKIKRIGSVTVVK